MNDSMLPFPSILTNTVKKTFNVGGPPPNTYDPHQNPCLSSTPYHQHNTDTPLPHHRQTPRFMTHQTPGPIPRNPTTSLSKLDGTLICESNF